MSFLLDRCRQGLKDSVGSSGNMILAGAYGAGAIPIDGYYKFYQTSTLIGANDTIRYLVEDGDNFEIGTGFYQRYTYATSIINRTPEQSLLNGTAATSGIALNAGAIVSIIPARQDFSFQTAMAFLYGGP
jgi:hypothetical protein